METLERELDSAIAAAARARSEKRQAETDLRASELRALDVTKELENTTSRDYSIQSPSLLSNFELGKWEKWVVGNYLKLD